jgi:hypothetical protein
LLPRVPFDRPDRVRFFGNMGVFFGRFGTPVIVLKIAETPCFYRRMKHFFGQRLCVQWAVQFLPPPAALRNPSVLPNSL